MQAGPTHHVVSLEASFWSNDCSDRVQPVFATQPVQNETWPEGYPRAATNIVDVLLCMWNTLMLFPREPTDARIPELLRSVGKNKKYINHRGRCTFDRWIINIWTGAISLQVVTVIRRVISWESTERISTCQLRYTWKVHSTRTTK